MPRTLRIIADNECYHIINRANSGQLIFDSPTAYLEYQALLLKYSQKFNISIYHYVLMPSHIHLLVEPKHGELPRFMQGLTLAHTRRVNNRRQSHGHLWQGRYKSLLIKKDSYFLRCGQYIELNPVRAGMVLNPSDYSWSSYHAYAKGILDPIVTLDQFYLDLGTTVADRQNFYTRSLAEAI